MPTRNELSSDGAARRTLDDTLRAWASHITQPVASGLARLKVHPNTLTVIGFLLNAVAGGLAAAGWVRFAGLMTLFASSTDALDGTLARMTGTQSAFGAFLDSTLDRLSEGAVLLGLIWWYGRRGELPLVVLLAATLLASVMVSYTRARAEGLGYTCKVGLLTRPMRVFILGLGMLFPALLPTVLSVMCVLTWFTVAQRIAHVYRSAQREL